MGASRNAVRVLAELGGEQGGRLGRERVRSVAALVRRYELDLVGYLNGADRVELILLARGVGIGGARTPGQLRQRLWAWGAAYEREALGEVPAEIQPAPLMKAGRLELPRVSRAAAGEGVLTIARRARFPVTESWPRPVPPPRDPPSAAAPEDLDGLLGRADALVGVRLGARGRDKGHYGQRIAALLGVAHDSSPSPDWRGEVELKSLAVVRAAGGWRIKDGPALSMRSVDARKKLARVLWIVRVDEGEVPGSPVLCWYYQELDGELAGAFEAARHLRPKGGKGTTGRGWYLRRGFFEACGLMRALNG